MTRWVSILVVLILSACASKPTKILTETEVPRWQKDKLRQLGEKVEYEKGDLLFDARPFFIYKLSHVEGAHSILPSDFFMKQSGGRYQLIQRHYFQARRLSRYGLDQKQKVLLLGRGPNGEGEEWLLALYLEYLGVETTEPILSSALGFKETTEVPIMPKARPTWKPRLDQSLIVSPEKLKLWTKEGSFSEANAIVIDTRESGAYLKSNAANYNGAKVINIPWKEFLTENSRPNTKLFSKLVGVGLHPKKRILCVGDKPSHSAVACMILRRMGFVEAGIYLP